MMIDRRTYAVRVWDGKNAGTWLWYREGKSDTTQLTPVLKEARHYKYRAWAIKRSREVYRAYHENQLFKNSITCEVVPLYES